MKDGNPWYESTVNGARLFPGPCLCLPLLILLLSGCAAIYPVNPPLTHIDENTAYNYQNVTGESDKSNKVLLMLAFSGGGTRAAAFSYGVLKELSETPIGQEGHKHPLSDEVDVITSVSGGSFTAAYFGLYGDRIFKDYEHDFLRRDVQG
jgi:NTE family protein